MGIEQGTEQSEQIRQVVESNRNTCALVAAAAELMLINGSDDDLLVAIKEVSNEMKNQLSNLALDLT